MMKQSHKRLIERRAKRDDVLEIARFIWRREGKQISEFVGNRDFWESFGCRDHVVVDMQNLIQDNNEVPGKSEIKHIHWA